VLPHDHLTRRANQRHDAIIAARVIGGVLANRASRALPEEQKAGKKMRQFGKVGIPQEAFIAALKVDSLGDPSDIF
jgi:translation elongation factor EF-4